jgi:hypothetical protein
LKLEAKAEAAEVQDERGGLEIAEDDDDSE